MHILIHQFFKFYLEQLFPKPSLFFLFGENPFHSSSPTIIHIPEKHAIQLSHTNFSLLHILFCSNTQLSKFAFFKHVHENIFFPPDLILAFDGEKVRSPSTMTFYLINYLLPTRMFSQSINIKSYTYFNFGNY